MAILLAELNHQLQLLNAPPQAPSADLAPALECQGRNLWNLCIRLKRDAEETPPCQERAKLLVRARRFAFQLLELGRSEGSQRHTDQAAEAAYLLRLALTLARNSLCETDLDSARFALQKAAACFEQLQAPDPTHGLPLDSTAAGRRLEAEYLTMRTALVRESRVCRALVAASSIALLTALQSWREDRLDVAEHMFRKMEALGTSLDVSSAEHMADTVRQIGADAASRKDHAMALKWLRRADDLLATHDLDKLSVHGLELRLSICHDRLQSLLGVGTPEALEEAEDLVAHAESEVGDKPVVLHWRLELLQRGAGQAVDDVDSYAAILRRMMRAPDLSDPSLDYILHHIKELGGRSSPLACHLLDELIRSRLAQPVNLSWMGKAMVRRVWMETTMEPESAEPRPTLLRLLDDLSDGLPELLSPEAAGAVHSVRWESPPHFVTKIIDFPFLLLIHSATMEG